MTQQPPKIPVRQWVVESDDPFIRRTPEEAQLYFKRRREKRRERTMLAFMLMEKDRILAERGWLDA